MIKNFNNRDSKYKPKISFFAASLRGGGAERAVVDLANCLSDHDYLVDLVLVTKEGPYLSEIATMSHVNIIALLACRLACVNTRVIVREVTDSSSNHIDKVKNGIGKGRLIANAINRLYPKAEYIVAVSDGVAKSLIANCDLRPGCNRGTGCKSRRAGRASLVSGKIRANNPIRWQVMQRKGLPYVT